MTGKFFDFWFFGNMTGKFFDLWFFGNMTGKFLAHLLLPSLGVRRPSVNISIFF
jgi:hypothetical protein